MIKNIFFCSGRRDDSCGAALKEVMDRLNCSYGGYYIKITEDPNNKDVRIFDLTSLYDGEEGNVFFTKDDSTCISKLNKDVFDEKGVEILTKSFNDRDIIVMDEIGFLESKAEKFTSEVFNILSSEKVVIGVIKWRDCEYINKVSSRDDVHIIDVSYDRIEEAKEEAIELLRNLNVPLK